MAYPRPRDGVWIIEVWEGSVESCAVGEEQSGGDFGWTVRVVCISALAFAKWWVDTDVAMKEGKYYRGVVGPDTTELVFWTALVSQTYLSVASLGQLLIRQHTGGVSWGSWYVLYQKL